MITTILAFIVVLGITITIHEFGHFAMAKLLKIRVLIFSIGFGPRLFGFTRGGTEYRLSPFPLGGYVKMAGETYDSDREGAPDEFLSHPKWHRFLVAVSGPLMNILLAVFISTVFFVQGVEVPKYEKEPPLVGLVMEDSIAQQAGLQTGDRVLSVSGNPVDTWKEMDIALGTAPKESLDIEVLRDNQTLILHFDAKEIDAQKIDPVFSSTVGFMASLPIMTINTVDRNKPAGLAGMQAKDQILSVSRNGKKEKNPLQITDIIAESTGMPLIFEVFRPEKNSGFNRRQAVMGDTPGEIVHLNITPIEKDGKGIAGFGFNYTFPTDLQKYSLGIALVQAIQHNYENVVLTFRVIGRMIKGSASVRNLSGPIGIAQISGEAARSRDIRFFLELVGFISLQLGIFNLLPIPILDGGVIALLLIEGAIRRDLSLNLKEKIIQAGFVFLILLMGFAVFNDLSKVIDFTKIFG